MGRPPKIDRQQVLSSAMQKFWKLGYRQTSLENLEEATGLQRGSLYSYFGDKRGIFLESVRLYRERVVMHRRALVDAAPNARRGIEMFFEEIAKPVAGTTHYWGCLNTNLATELCSEEDREMAQMIEQGIMAWENYWQQVCRRGKKDGSLPKSLNVRAVAKSLVIITQGSNVVSKGLGESSFSRAGIKTLLKTLLR